MILDIENNFNELTISYFNKEGNIRLKKYKLTEEQCSNWRLCSESDTKKSTQFRNWDGKPVKKVKDKKLQILIEDAGIIRNQLKIRAAVANAIAFMKVQEEFGSFSEYIWQFTDGKPIINSPQHLKEVPATSPLSDAISKDLKKRGFKYCGPVIVYAFMQAVGMINDHETGCPRHPEVSP